MTSCALTYFANSICRQKGVEEFFVIVRRYFYKPVNYFPFFLPLRDHEKVSTTIRYSRFNQLFFFFADNKILLFQHLVNSPPIFCAPTTDGDFFHTLYYTSRAWIGPKNKKSSRRAKFLNPLGGQTWIICLVIESGRLPALF